MKTLASFIILVFWFAGIQAQQTSQPEKYENVSWHQIVLVDFKAGKVNEAQKIIDKFEKAGTEEGKPEMYWLDSGEYDLMLIWDMENGPSDMEWKRSPSSVKWWNKLVEQEGSEENAMKLQNDYSELVSSSTSYISRKEKD